MTFGKPAAASGTSCEPFGAVGVRVVHQLEAGRVLDLPAGRQVVESGIRVVDVVRQIDVQRAARRARAGVTGGSAAGEHRKQSDSDRRRSKATAFSSRSAPFAFLTGREAADRLPSTVRTRGDEHLFAALRRVLT